MFCKYILLNSKHSWPLNNMGLISAGPLMCSEDFFLRFVTALKNISHHKEYEKGILLCYILT